MTPGHGQKLTRFQEAAIAALLGCGTIEAAAKKIHVEKKTLLRWMALESFQTAYKAARARVLEDVATYLASGGKSAVQTLKRNTHKSIGTPATQTAAATALLDRMLRARELLDLEERVAALEAAKVSGPRAGGV